MLNNLSQFFDASNVGTFCVFGADAALCVGLFRLKRAE